MKTALLLLLLVGLLSIVSQLGAKPIELGPKHPKASYQCKNIGKQKVRPYDFKGYKTNTVTSSMGNNKHIAYNPPKFK